MQVKHQESYGKRCGVHDDIGHHLKTIASQSQLFLFLIGTNFSTLVTQLFVEGCIFGQLAETEVMFP